jgi:hypothetical protein
MPPTHSRCEASAFFTSRTAAGGRLCPPRHPAPLRYAGREGGEKMRSRRFARRTVKRALRERARSSLQLSNSPMMHVRLAPDMHHRPGSLFGLGKPVVMRAWRLRQSRQINAVLAHKGRAERQGVSPRPRRHVLKAHGSVCESTRQTQPRKRLNARVPHANGLCGLLHVPGVVACADAPPFVRAVARTCTWTVRPSRRRLSLSVRGSADPLLGQGPAS